MLNFTPANFAGNQRGQAKCKCNDGSLDDLQVSGFALVIEMDIDRQRGYDTVSKKNAKW